MTWECENCESVFNTTSEIPDTIAQIKRALIDIQIDTHTLDDLNAGVPTVQEYTTCYADNPVICPYCVSFLCPMCVFESVYTTLSKKSKLLSYTSAAKDSEPQILLQGINMNGVVACPLCD